MMPYASLPSLPAVPEAGRRYYQQSDLFLANCGTQCLGRINADGIGSASQNIWAYSNGSDPVLIRRP
jgi:hypothetical protein